MEPRDPNLLVTPDVQGSVTVAGNEQYQSGNQHFGEPFPPFTGGGEASETVPPLPLNPEP